MSHELSMTASRMQGQWIRQIWALVLKDLALDWRERTRLHAVFCFGALSLLLFSFAVGPQPHMLARLAAGFLWLAILLSSVLSLGESMRHESRDHAQEGLLLLGMRPSAMFLAKALTNTCALWLLSVVLVPVALALYDAPCVLGLGWLLWAIMLGCAAISAPGTLYAALGTYAQARDLLLPLLLFPILIPGLLAAVKATSLILLGDPMGELAGWLLLLVVFNGIYWPLCTVLFGRVIDT